MKLQNNDRILFIGDSVTDSSRDKSSDPNGSDLGSGYVSMVDAMLAVRYPDIRIDVVNTGVNGNRVIDLESRWQSDAIDIEPDWLSILIGFNDVWRQIDPQDTVVQVDPELFESTYRKILDQIRPTLKGLILMAPYIIENDRNDPTRIMLAQYGAIVEKLASEFDGHLVELQPAFDARLEHRDPETYSSDRIHPTMTGHLVIAKNALRTLDFQWD